MTVSLDIVSLLRNQLQSLPQGDHTSGLKAVMLHIESAIRHLERGQRESDDTAFTDVIYRTNQAFEGSIKEAYRVLAGTEPDNKTPSDIEKYLEKNGIFRPRVLTMFTRYRQEWRNPSAHQYQLDFDEREAVVAVINVATFAYLLTDQITESVARSVAHQHAPVPTPKATEATLLDRLVAGLRDFARLPRAAGAPEAESYLLGAIAGFLESVAPDLKVTIDPPLSPDNPHTGDLLVESIDQKVLIEVKRADRLGNAWRAGYLQLQSDLKLSQLSDGILYVHPPAGRDLEMTRNLVESPKMQILTLIPHRPIQA